MFGSKIDSNSSAREDYYTVKDIISPIKILLNNNLIIRLLGIKENPSSSQEAISFLEAKTKGKKVFLRFDNQKYDEENNLLCCIYLENKTFVNAHLIRNGLVKVDSEVNFKYKEKFNSLSHEF